MCVQDYCENLPECAKTYRAECWQQFMFYASAWLYKATRLLEYKSVRLNLCFGGHVA